LQKELILFNKKLSISKTCLSAWLDSAEDSIKDGITPNSGTV